MNRNFVLLDGLRGIAAIAVMWLHVSQLMGVNHSGVRLAVDFFFALSGFVLAYAYDERLSSGQLSWSAFMKARLIRLYPLYALATLLSMALLANHLLRGVGEAPATGPFVISTITAVLFLPSPMSFNHEAFPYLGPAWSLFYELVANAIYAALAPRLTNKVLAIWLIGAAALLTATALHFGTLNVGPDVPNFFGGVGRVCYSFFAGVAVHRIWRAGSQVANVPAAVPVGLLLAMLYFSGRLRFDLPGIFFVAPLIVYLGARAVVSPRLAAGAGVIGAASYALYAVHFPIAEGFIEAMPHLGLTPSVEWNGPLYPFMAAALLISIGLERFYDRPVRRWLANAFRSGRPDRTKTVVQPASE